MIRASNRSRGQLTVGLAIAFTMVVAVFGMILRMGLITREKMKMQQTSDLATLAGADVQRQALNKIWEINEEIEKIYNIAQTALAVPSFCVLHVLPSAAWQCSAVQTATAPFGGKVVEGEQKPNVKLPGPCSGCEDYDAFMRDKIVQAYRIGHAILTKQIFEIIMGANKAAMKAALQTYWIPGNLPFGLQAAISKQYGGNISADFLISEYERGTLEGYVIEEAAKEMPLFVPKMEPRLFVYERMKYGSYINPLSVCMCAPPTLGPPGAAFTTAKVVRDGKYETSFFTGALYLPPKDETQKYNLFVKNAGAGDDVEEKDKFLKDEQGKKLKLFRDRWIMKVMSFAKPFGGTFASADFITTAANKGKNGEDFKGAKLIGLADQKNEIGGDFLNFGETWGDDETLSWSTEDYLH